MALVSRLLGMTKTIMNPQKLVWKKPPQADLVVYDQVLISDVARVILPGLKFEVFPVRGEFFYVHPLIVFGACMHWLRRKVTPRQAYEIAALSAFRPKVLVTYIDNNPNFPVVSKVLEVTTFVIQNGFRSHHCADQLKELPAIYCFGRRDLDLYASHNFPIAELKPVGSIKSSYFLDQIAPNLQQGSKYDICLISSYQPGMEKSDFFEPEEYRRPLVEGTQKGCQYLARLRGEKDLKIVIAGWQKPGENQGELAFFQRYFGDQVSVVSAHQEPFSSYKLAYQSKVVLSYGSTLGYEALSWGHKAFFFYMPNEKNYRLDRPHSALFQIQEGTYEEFRVKLNTVFDMPLSQYRNEVRDDANYVITAGGEPAYQVLRRLIQQALVAG